MGIAAALAASAAAETDLSFESADAVNEGTLQFLVTPPAKAVHHHQNRIRIDAAMLDTGWVALAQCHEHLDAVPRTQITFREGYVRDLAIDAQTGIGRAWVEGASVQLADVKPGARLCLTAFTRALRLEDGRIRLVNGPYMRRFLDGYYPMRVTLEVEYPSAVLRVVYVEPAPQPGLAVSEAPGRLRLDALFEGELRTEIAFERLTPAP